MLRVPAAALIALMMIATAPARAEKTPQELAREGAERLLQALELLLQSIPQYEMPEITEDGDIIIRRKRPEKDDDRKDGPPSRSRDKDAPNIDET